MLSEYLLQQARDDRHRAYLINREIDGIRCTIVRQTMFADFDKIAHDMSESGEPLTVGALKETYRKLLCSAVEAACPLTQEELDRRGQETGGRALAEIWKSLGQS